MCFLISVIKHTCSPSLAARISSWRSGEVFSMGSMPTRLETASARATAGRVIMGVAVVVVFVVAPVFIMYMVRALWMLDTRRWADVYG